MKIENTKLDGVKMITTNPFIDFRGAYLETYNESDYKKAGIAIDFIQDDISTSRKSVLRGIHGDSETWKLITCLHGSFYLVVVNNDPNSLQYKNWQGFTLSDTNNIQILVPPNFGNGHLVLTDNAIFHYKQSTYYNPTGQFTIVWNDPQYKIWWPIKQPIVSQRDEIGSFVE